MASHNKTLQLIASKLGLGEEEKVLRKAAEFERLLQTKTIAGSNMTDTSKVVICLDLASYVLGADLDTKTAIKYAGLKPTMYMNCRKIIENLLELNSDKMTVSGLCVMLQCSGVQALAERILEEYQKQAKVEIDLNLPQYVCMAVYHACRINKVKISKSKIIEKSRLKSTQWAKLDTDWTKFVDENFAAAKKKRGRPLKNMVTNDEELNINIETSKKQEPDPEPEMEPYEDWKKRMLEAAYKELREMEEIEKFEKNKKLSVEKMEEDVTLPSPMKKKQFMSPRADAQFKSPRKNSQLLSPRKDTRMLSPRKDAHLLSPRKETRLSTKEALKILLNKDTVLSPKREFSSPKKDNQIMSPRHDGSMSPRRSPRKTPQKFSPYKPPSHKNGIRLLFPKDV